MKQTEPSPYNPKYITPIAKPHEQEMNKALELGLTEKFELIGQWKSDVAMGRFAEETLRNLCAAYDDDPANQMLSYELERMLDVEIINHFTEE